MLEGVDCESEIYFNGVLLGKTSNMFIPYEYDVSALAMVGKNEIKVHLLPVYSFLDQQEHGWALFNHERMQLRKTACAFGWDWSPNLPGYGIYRPVHLDFYEERFEALSITPSNDGNVAFDVSVSKEGTAEVMIEKKAFGPFSLQKGSNHFVLHLENPRLWYPNEIGESVLYYGNVSFHADGVVYETRSFHFAFRKIELIQEKIDEQRTSFYFKVNGQRIFVKGANWVPPSNQTGAIKDETYLDLLKSAKDAHFNMLRVWGGGNYERDLFYDLCDRYGLLVWQDYMLACQKEPLYPSFREDFAQEAAYQCARLHEHPCLALLCGGNELYYKKEEADNPINSMLQGISEKYAPDIPFIPSTPFGGNEDQWDLLSGDSHASCFEKALLANDVSNYPKYIEENRAQFYSESAILGSCRYRSLLKFLPKEKLWPLNDLYDLHFYKNPYALDPKETFALKELRLGEGLYGKVTDVYDFVKKSSLAQGEILFAEISFARSNPDCGGFMNWMYNDNWGCGTWSVIDVYREKKPAYYFEKRAFRPISCRFVSHASQLHLYLQNETKIDEELTLSYGSGTFEKERSHKERDILILGGKILEITPLDFFEERDDYWWVCLTRKGDLIDEDIYLSAKAKKAAFRSDVSLSYLGEKKEGIWVLLKASSFARAVRLSYPLAVDFSDNYFDMRPGEIRKIFVKGLGKGDFPKLSLKTFADRWDD